MPEIIIKTKNGDVIPAISPEAFGLAVQSMEELDAQMKELELKAKALPREFQSRSDYEQAANILVQKKSLVKLSEATMLPFVELVKKVKTFIDQQKNIVGNHGEIVTSIVQPAMVDWDAREKRAAEAEQKRIQAEQEQKLKREAEEKAQKDAAAAEQRKKQRIEQIREDLKAKKITKRIAEKLLREAGASEEAELARIAADKEDADAKAATEAAKVKVKPNTGAVAGITRRTNWKFRIVNPQQVRINYLSPDEVKIGEKVRELKDKEKAEREVGGIEVYEEKTF